MAVITGRYLLRGGGLVAFAGGNGHLMPVLGDVGRVVARVGTHRSDDAQAWR
jgi:uncharacterized cupin superfamily protein